MEHSSSKDEIDSLSSSITTLELTPRLTSSPLPMYQECSDSISSSPVTPSRRRPSFQPIPPSLIKPGTEMLKVSSKSTRRVQIKKVWLELGTGYGPGDVKFCWEKNGRGVGKNRNAAVAISTIRNFRHGPDISPYRTSLHLSPIVESRWMTIIYLDPTSPALPLSFINNVSQTPAYKLAHFIAPNDESFLLWRETVEAFLEEKRGGESKDWEELRWRESESEINLQENVESMQVVREDEVSRLCRRLGVGMGKDEIATAFRETAAPLEYLDFTAFQNFVKLLKRRVEIDEIYLRQLAAFDDLGLSLTDWTTFLIDVQHFSSQDGSIARSFIKFADPLLNRVTLDGFNAFLISSDNAATKDDSNQVMSRPLCEYYISSSHNTYLVGNQIQGESTVEGYIRALQQGCRCVELDVWDGDDDTPVITHGRTFTSKISARDALQAISKYAFLASPYPVILSLEIHCDLIQQEKLVVTLKEILGDRLVTTRIDEGLDHRLPSPEILKGKFVLKAKHLAAVHSSESPISSVIPDASTATGESSTNSDSDFKRVFKAVRRGIEGRSRPGYESRESASSGSLPTRPSTAKSFEAISQKSLLCPSLIALLIYTIGIKPRGFNRKEIYDYNHVLSFGENRLSKMIKDEDVRQDFIGHNRSHLTRAYPKTIRLNSTNFFPHHLWAVGVQMVAVNWQTFDVGMELNNALFARAGRSGYVLKPDLLRRKGGEKDKEALFRSTSYVFEIEIISAQQLPRSKEALATDAVSVSMDPFVELSLFIPGSSTVVKKRTKVVKDNAFNPLFRSAVISIPFSLHPSPGMLDLAFVRFEVLNAKGNIKSATEEGKGEFVGAFTTALGGLQFGYRHLPLYDSLIPNLMSSPVETAFATWFTSRGGTVSPKLGLAQFGEMGRGAIALEDIEADTVLFSIPRTSLLTTSTSLLPSLLPPTAWDSLKGWSPLILILMYERLRSDKEDVENGWISYFNIMPAANSFDSLMFWSDEELKELEGSMVLGKIGKEEAEEDFAENVLPFVTEHESIFGAKERYTLELFHHMGSLVLSRSFHVEVDGGDEVEESDDEEEEETESVGDVAMVPMADLLNARSGSDNARLFYEPSSLNMLATENIPAGTQIFNTYADPPNSDLLRRYGHIDETNSSDLVEIGLEMVVDLIGIEMELSEAERETRAEWLLEVGIEDTFTLDNTHVLSDELISTIRTFVGTATDFEKAQGKESPPRPKMDAQVAEWGRRLIVLREAQYPTSIAVDEELLLPTHIPTLTSRHRMAIIVRLSEKKILRATFEKLQIDFPAGVLPTMVIDKNQKRKGEDSNAGRKKSKK